MYNRFQDIFGTEPQQPDSGGGGGPPTGPAGNALIGTYPNPGLHPLETEIFVDFNTTQPSMYRTGSIAAPFLTMQEAMTFISLSGYPSFHVHVVPGNNLSGFSVPPNKKITIQSSIWNETHIGNISWTIADPANSSVLILRNIQADDITAADGVPIASNAQLIIEQARVASITNSGASTLFVNFDSASTFLFFENGGTVTNSIVTRDKELGESGLTFFTPPTLEGQLYSYTSDSSVNLASAGAIVTARAFAGVWNNTMLQGTQGRVYPVRMEPNLVLVTNTPIYLSKLIGTVGLGTNVKPTTPLDIIKVIGYIRDISGYNGFDPTGSLVLAKLEQQPLAIVP